MLRFPLFLLALAACPRPAETFVELERLGRHLDPDRAVASSSPATADALTRAATAGAVAFEPIGVTMRLDFFEGGRPTHGVVLTWMHDRHGLALVDIARTEGAFAYGSPFVSLAGEARALATPIAKLAEQLVDTRCPELPIATSKRFARLPIPITSEEADGILRTPERLTALCRLLAGHRTDDLNVHLEAVTWLARDARSKTVGLLSARPTLSRGQVLLTSTRFQEQL